MSLSLSFAILERHSGDGGGFLVAFYDKFAASVLRPDQIFQSIICMRNFHVAVDVNDATSFGSINKTLKSNFGILNSQSRLASGKMSGRRISERSSFGDPKIDMRRLFYYKQWSPRSAP